MHKFLKRTPLIKLKMENDKVIARKLNSEIIWYFKDTIGVPPEIFIERFTEIRNSCTIKQREGFIDYALEHKSFYN